MRSVQSPKKPSCTGPKRHKLHPVGHRMQNGSESRADTQVVEADAHATRTRHAAMEGTPSFDCVARSDNLGCCNNFQAEAIVDW